MNARAGFLMVALAAVFTFGLIHVFSLRFASGDVYPDCSSMKATPDGAKLLYDSLARTAGVTVTRNYFPLPYLEGSDAAVLFLALNLGQLSVQPEPYERLANSGARVVAALAWKEKEKPEKTGELEKRWSLKIGIANDKAAHHLFFAESPGWQVIEQEGPAVLAIERSFGRGSVVLFAESRDFSNASTVGLGRLGAVAAALGARSRVVFDEQHFGIEESGTVAGLARRFRLNGVALGLALCAALFIWKNAAGFPPAVEKPPGESFSGRTSLAGLVTLLGRHIRPGDLAATCWSEWLIAHRNDLAPGRQERVEAILREPGLKPLEAVRQIQTVLQSKGPL